MIDVECPHCKRILKISEKYIGVEGACKHCGGRLVIADDTPPSEFEPSAHGERPVDRVPPELVAKQETITELTANIEVLHARVSQNRHDIERLAKDLETERVARAEAAVARDVALVRVKCLDMNLAAIGEKVEDGALRAEFECSGAQLAQSRTDVGRLANELETERAARIRAETAYRMMELRTRRVQEQFRRLIQEKSGPKAEAAVPVSAVAQDPVDSKELAQAAPEDLAEAVGLCIDSLVPSEGEIDHAVAIDNPEIEPASESEAPKEESAEPTPEPKRTWAGWAAAALLLVVVAGGLATYYTKPLWMHAPSRPSGNLPDSGVIEASVAYMTSRQPEAPTAPAARAVMVVARQQFDAKAFQELLQEAGVPQDAWAELSQWFYLAEPDIPDAKKFPSAGVPDNAPLIEARKKLAVLADKAGRDAFNKRLVALLAFDAPKDWAEETVADTGVVVVRNLVPGRYAILPRPDGPRETWNPIDPATKDLTLAVVRKGETARCALKLVDAASAIRGQVTDAESGKPLAKVALAVSGDIATGKKLTVTTKEDGSFLLDPLDTGYGAFNLACVALPKGYLNSTTFGGTRERGVALAKGVIQLSKKAAPKETKKVTLSGRVLASDGTPAPGFGIWAVGEDGSGKSLARSGRDGTYEFAHTGGTMRLRAAGSGTARTEPVGVELQPSQSATRDFVLPACGRIVLVIKKPDGTVPDAFDACNLGCSSGVMSDPSMMQRDGDKFVIAYLIGDVYDLTFHVKGFKPVSLPGTVIDKNGGDRELTVALEPVDAAPPPVSP